MAEIQNEFPYIFHGEFFVVTNIDKANGKIAAACQECLSMCMNMLVVLKVQY